MIKEMREELNLTQSQFAEKLRVPLKTLQNWEQNRNHPSEIVINYIKEVCDGLKTSNNLHTSINKDGSTIK